MLPAVFAVENDTDQGRLATVDRLADAPQMVDEILGGGDRLAALVMEADHVAESVVAKNDAQLMARLGDLVGPIHPIGVAHMPPAVAAHEALRGMAQNLLIGGDPADAMLRQQRQHRLAAG